MGLVGRAGLGRTGRFIDWQCCAIATIAVADSPAQAEGGLGGLPSSRNFCRWPCLLLPAATSVQLLEDQLLEGCSGDSQQQQPPEQQLQDEVWRAVESRLGGGAAGQLPAGALAAAFTNALTAPGRLSRPALHAALAQLGSSTSLEEVLQGDLADLKEQLPRWLAATAGGAAAAAAAGAAGGSGAALCKWTALLRAYAAAWRRQHLPLALLKLPQKGVSHALLLARQGGLITGLRPAAAPELAQHDTLPPEWQQAGAEGAEEAAVVLQAAKAVFQAAGGAQLARCVRGAGQ